MRASAATMASSHTNQYGSRTDSTLAFWRLALPLSHRHFQPCWGFGIIVTDHFGITVQFEKSHLTDIFETLRDPFIFQQVHISDGAVAWPRDLDSIDSYNKKLIYIVFRKNPLYGNGCCQIVGSELKRRPYPYPFGFISSTLITMDSPGAFHSIMRNGRTG